MRRSSIYTVFVLTTPAAIVLGLSAAQKDKPGVSKPLAARAFDRFAPQVKTRWDEAHIFVESDGMPDHELMVGIRAWQQQVPLPQPYSGDNAWQFPLAPVPAQVPLSAKTDFFRGAIAIAVNGVPIFNPIKNDGKTDTYLAGELDAFGGHSGRADDYHYHIAPVFLNAGDPAKPVAFALDGYPIFGFTEPDGSKVAPLDEFNGHEDKERGYHYHATKTYPYLNGGFHGRVVEKEGQVDPQPHAHPVREATSPLPGARITAFHAEEDRKTFTLTYDLRGKTGTVQYSILDDGTYRFVFTDPDGSRREQIYDPDTKKREGVGQPPPNPPARGDRPRKGPDSNDPNREPWLAAHLGEMDVDHDGVLAREELKAEVQRTHGAYDRDGDGRISVSERDTGNARSAMGGFVKEHWSEVDSDGDGAITLGELDRTAQSMFQKSDRDHDGRITAAEFGAGASREEPRQPGRREGGQGGNPRGERGGRGGSVGVVHTTVPEHPFDLILGRPTRDSITVSARIFEEGEGYVEYGIEGEKAVKRTDARPLRAAEPAEFALSSLRADTRYSYRFLYRAKAQSEFSSSELHTFTTQRAAGRPFTFTVQADSHLDEGSEPAIYERSLRAQAADNADFVIDLGDTFMTDKYGRDFRTAASQYEAQRYFMGLLARTSPLFLVLGNHDGESRWRTDGPADDMPHWSNAMRTRLFPSPAPDSFYSGNEHPDAHNGLLRDYFAFTWGDALFVALDPFLKSNDRGARDDPWRWTLGADQYAWLAKTLSESRAIFKFVFTHHLVGGIDKNARGGSEAARLFEWGGRELDGTTTFAAHRPGFEAPIHELLVRAGVSAVFHGHDHFFAKQDLDGIVYQLVPQPSHDGSDVSKMMTEGGYVSGKFLTSPGYMRVEVTPERARVDFVQPDGDDPAQRKVAFSYTLEPSAKKPTTGSKPAPESPATGGTAPKEKPDPAGKGTPNEDRPARGNRTRGPAEGPLSGLSVILGRPTAASISVSVLSAADIEVRVDSGLAATELTKRSPVVSCRAGVPAVIEIDGLAANTEYFYSVLARAGSTAAFEGVESGDFHTQRPPGSTFTFALQGDSHPERSGKMYDPVLYERTLTTAAAGDPDFYFTLGDDFSIERFIERDTLSQSNVDGVYAHQRGFLGLVGRTAPLFLVNGNHEEAAGYLLDGTPENAAVFAGRARTRFFPLPTPSGFYTGDAEPVEHVGLLSDYYAFEWGDALFVVIDPYWHSPVQVDADAGGGGGKGEKRGKAGGRRDMWGITLGDAQYRWFSKTLRESKSRYKFVFAHHVLGTGRGGVDVANLYEWGGEDNRGNASFAEKRPGWDLPIHPLMAKTGVTIFFQGHDHLFARQEKDGVVYQETPNPADPTYQAFNREAYRSGDILPNSGFLRVTVAHENVRVDYVRCCLDTDPTSKSKNGEIAFSYTISGVESNR